MEGRGWALGWGHFCRLWVSLSEVGSHQLT